MVGVRVVGDCVGIWVLEDRVVGASVGVRVVGLLVGAGEGRNVGLCVGGSVSELPDSVPKDNRKCWNFP